MEELYEAGKIRNIGMSNFELDKTDLQTIATLDLNKTQIPEWG